MKNFPFATNQFGNHAIECIVFLLQKGKQNGESVSTFPVPLDTFQALVFLAVHEESPLLIAFGMPVSSNLVSSVSSISLRMYHSSVSAKYATCLLERQPIRAMKQSTPSVATGEAFQLVNAVGVLVFPFTAIVSMNPPSFLLFWCFFGAFSRTFSSSFFGTRGGTRGGTRVTTHSLNRYANFKNSIGDSSQTNDIEETGSWNIQCRKNPHIHKKVNHAPNHHRPCREPESTTYDFLFPFFHLSCFLCCVVDVRLPLLLLLICACFWKLQVDGKKKVNFLTTRWDDIQCPRGGA